jgi:hypothetical protein
MTNHRFVKRTGIAISLVILYAVITFAWFIWLFTREKAPPGAKNVFPQKLKAATK